MKGEYTTVLGWEFYFEGDVDSYTTSDTYRLEAFTCMSCGALTVERDTHARWHDRLDFILKGIE